MDYLENVSDGLCKMASWAEAEFSEPISGELIEISGQTKNCVDGLNQGIENARIALLQIEGFRQQFEEFLNVDLNAVAEGNPSGGSYNGGTSSSTGAEKVLTLKKQTSEEHRGRH